MRKRIEKLMRLLCRVERGAKRFRKGESTVHTSLFCPFSNHDSPFVGLCSSLNHDAAAPPQCWKLLPPCLLPTRGSPRSQTQSKSPLGHTSLPPASTFLGATKGLHPSKRPHSLHTLTMKSAAPAQPANIPRREAQPTEQSSL